MKILVLLNSDFGIQNTIGARALPIARNLLKKKALAKIICRDCNKNLKEFEDFIIKPIPLGNLIPKLLTGIPIYLTKRFPSNKLKNYIFEYFSKKYLKNLDFDILHSWDFTPKLYKLAKSKNSKIIQDVAMAFPNVLKNIKNSEKLFKNEKIELPNYVKDALNYVDYFIVPSDFVKDSLIKEKISEQKIFVVPFGVDVKKFKPLENKDNKLFKVAFAGNINNRKGIPYLIQAWKELNLKDAELNLYGRVYPEVKKYLKDAEKYNIRLHGFVSNINEELPKNHIFVFPSLLEGSAKSVYEALACGLPVITTYNSGSIIRDKVEGFIIPIQNVKAIKDKILYFYNHREQIKIFGKRARKLAEKYTLEIYGKRIVEIYKLVSENE